MSQATRALRRTSLAAIGILVTTAAAAFPAHAAAPRNDSIASPTVVHSIPSTFTQDTSQATSVPSDGECVKGASIWYRYRPLATSTARVVTVGSDYDTVLAVYRGFRSNRSLVACNDDGVGLQSAARVRFVTGHTYWIAVSACCNRRALGGHSVLTLYRNAAAGATSTVGAVETGGLSGRLFVNGTIRCNTPSVATVEVLATQRVGDAVARGDWGTDIANCTPAGASWRIPIDSETGWAFQPGTAVLTVWTSASDGFASVANEQTVNSTVVNDPDARGVRPR